MKQSLDFVVVGAQKSGTTTLFEHLRPHPELHLPPGKEAPYFSDEEQWEGGWSLYARRYFGGASDDVLWGTVTPQYMYGTLSRGSANGGPTERIVPERIAQHSPEALIVAILRDPVERAFSHYRMEAMRGAEQRSFTEAIDELLDPAQLRRSRAEFAETTAYVTNGEFGRILEPYFELFGPERVHVCFSADLAGEPAATVSGVVRFIGADEEFEPPNLGERYRVGGSRRRIHRFDLYALQERIADTRAIRAAWRAMPHRLRTRVDQTYKEAAYQVDVRNRVAAGDADAPAPEDVARLRAHFAEDRQQLRALIGAEPPW